MSISNDKNVVSKLCFYVLCSYFKIGMYLMKGWVNEDDFVPRFSNL